MREKSPSPDPNGQTVPQPESTIEGFISVKGRLVVKAAIEAGHAAAHRAYRPTATDLERVMDIVENIIQHDVLHESAAALRAATPKRLKTRRAT